MRLLTACMETCTRLVRTQTADGSGGLLTVWSDGESFQGAIALSKSEPAEVSGKETTGRSYNVLTEKGVDLGFHEVFRRERDGAIFRTTGFSSDRQTPGTAALRLCCVTAERWELTQ